MNTTERHSTMPNTHWVLSVCRGGGTTSETYAISTVMITFSLDRETEALRGYVTYPRPNSQQMVNSGFTFSLALKSTFPSIILDRLCKNAFFSLLISIQSYVYILETRQRYVFFFKKSSTQIIQEDMTMQTVHLQCNHIKDFQINLSPLTEVHIGSAREPDAALWGE